jgi:ribonuclease HI
MNSQDIAIEEESEICKELGRVWKGILGKRRPWNKPVLDTLIEAHPKIHGPHKEVHEIDEERLDKIFTKSYNSSQGYDGTPFSLITSSYHLLKDVWIALIRKMAAGELNDNTDAFNTLLNLLPKKEGDVTALDFRPISVANTIYRLIMKYWAKVLADEVEEIISEPQRALLRGRTIGDAVRDIHDTYYNRIHRREDVILLQTDFSKAFDFVNRSALMRTLKKLNLPSYLLNIAKYATKDNKVTLVNTHPTTFRGVTGVRQGCPISPLLYIIVVDLLVAQLSKINGIVTMRAYADDNGLILNSTKPLKKIYYTIKLYEMATGAALNIEKSTLMGWVKRKLMVPNEWRGIKIVDETKYLGVEISNQPNHLTNWGNALRKIGDVSTYIKNMRVGFASKITLINTYLIPIIQYISSFSLMTFEVHDAIWKQIRRCLGTKGATRHCLIVKFQSMSLKPTITDPFGKNIAALLTSPPSRGNEDISPYSTQAHRRRALLHFKKLVFDSDPRGEMHDILSSPTRFVNWMEMVRKEKAAANIYNLCTYSPRHVVPPNLVRDLKINYSLASYWIPRNLKLCPGSPQKNAFMLLLSKCWPTETKVGAILKDGRNMLCKFCSMEQMTHAHLVASCDVIKWIYSNPFQSRLWPCSSDDILCARKDLVRDEVKVRLHILHCIFTGLQTDLNGPSLINHISSSLRLILKDIEERGMSNAKKEPRQQREPPRAPQHNHTMYFDGSVDPEKLNGGYGIAIFKGGSEIFADGEAVGNCTINEAEGLGLVNGMRRALSMEIRRISIYGDSQTILKMCRKDAPCNAPNLLEIYCEIHSLIRKFEEIEFIFTPREFNCRADVLAFTACNAKSELGSVIHDKHALRPSRTEMYTVPHFFPIPKVIVNPTMWYRSNKYDYAIDKTYSLTKWNNGNELSDGTSMLMSRRTKQLSTKTTSTSNRKYG